MYRGIELVGWPATNPKRQNLMLGLTQQSIIFQVGPLIAQSCVVKHIQLIAVMD